MHVVFVHFTNDDPVMAEVEELPLPTDSSIMLLHPRRRDGKDVHYLQPNVTSMFVPLHRVSFIELIPSETEEKVITPFRD